MRTGRVRARGETGDGNGIGNGIGYVAHIIEEGDEGREGIDKSIKGCCIRS